MSLLRLRRPALGQLSYLTLFALYIAVALNLHFYHQAFVMLPVNSLHNAAVFATLPLVAFCVINILLTLASFLWLERPLITLLVLGPAPGWPRLAAFPKIGYPIKLLYHAIV